MATQIVPAPERAEHQSPTAPLSPAALDAMDHLELRLRLPKGIVDAVVVYEAAAVRAAELAAKAVTGQGLPALDVRAWEFAEELMAGARATLAKAGRLDLIELDPDVQRAMVRYRICSETLAELDSRAIDTVPLFNELKNAQAGLAEARATLADAGMLHLIGGA